MTGREGWPNDDPGLLTAVTAFYRQALAGSSEAQGWLERHRLADVEGLETFGVGFADRTLGLSLPVKCVVVMMTSAAACSASGYCERRGMSTSAVASRSRSSTRRGASCRSTGAPCWMT